MKEAKWLACQRLAPMLKHLAKGQNERKLQLFAVACCRTIWGAMREEVSREAVEAAEQFADGLISKRDFDIAWVRLARKAQLQKLELPSDAARLVTLHTGYLAAHDVSRTVSAFAGSGATSNEERAVTVKKEQTRQVYLLRDIFGNPFRRVTVEPARRTANVTGLAEAIYAERAFDRLPILADALEDAGCTNVEVLDHCRQPGEHVRGCWVVDLLLGKE
jgi:hypothetical protein